MPLRQLRLTASLNVLGWTGTAEPFAFRVQSVLTSIGSGAVFPLNAAAALQVHDAANNVRFAVRSTILTAPVGPPPVLLTFAPNLPHSSADGPIPGLSPRWASCPIPDELWIFPGEYLSLEMDLGAGSDFTMAPPRITVLRSA